MGFFDKAKHFMGGHGVKVANTIIERQDPARATLPIGDTVVKGKFQVSTEKDCTVLAMKAGFYMEVKHPDGRIENVELGEDHFPDPHTSRQDDMVKYPYELKGGAAPVEDFFIISMQSDIPSELQKRNLQASQVRFFVKTMVDVKGSPFDPEASNDVRILA
jgi:hypothetical protein